MNIAIILGRMTRDPDIKVSQSGMTIARFTLAVNRGYKKDQKQEADFINCVAFGKTAESIGNYVYKGQRLLVEGRIQTGHYTDKSNQNASTGGFEQIGTVVKDPQWMEQEEISF